MMYTRNTYYGDYNVDETFEGEPKEILRLLSEIDGETELVYDQDEAVEFIHNEIGEHLENSRFTIQTILRLEEDYMRHKGIITDGE